ncbi:MAG: DKNYY domain-containing protein [Muribaculaceae bacterium]|nr:DKNYY domain-containing protein [Muribaculaceae bacterium]
MTKRARNITGRICAIIMIMVMLTACDVGYKNDGKTVTYHYWNEGSGHGSWKVDADPKTFEDLGDKYAHDASHAFFEGKVIEGADGATFRYLGKWYAVDAKHVFHLDTIMPEADPMTFKVHTSSLTEDAKDYYWDGRPIHVADKASFVVMGDKDGWDTKWAKDKKNAYFMGFASVPLADYESFKPINSIRYGSGSYAADKYQVYFQGHVVEGADPATFREVDFYVGQDKYRAYSEWHPSQVKDYSKLKQVGDMFTDGTHLYNDDLQTFDEADINTFHHVDGNWYADKRHVWWRETLVQGADAASFEPIYSSSFTTGRKEQSSGCDFNYGKDARHVFYRDSIISGADPATFEKIDFAVPGVSWTVFDKNHIYEGENTEALQKYLNKTYKKKT